MAKETRVEPTYPAEELLDPSTDPKVTAEAKARFRAAGNLVGLYEPSDPAIDGSMPIHRLRPSPMDDDN